MTALIARQYIDGSKPDTSNGVNVANFQQGTGNVWDALESLGGHTPSSISAAAITLTQADAGLKLVDAGSNNVVITLPQAANAVGAVFQFKRIDASSNTVTISRAGSDMIDGAASVMLLAQSEYEEMRSDGVSAWRRMNTLANPARGRNVLGIGSTLSFRNKLHNGNFAVNQRALSGTVTLAAGATGHDRWKAGSGGCTYTFAASGSDTVITITAGSLMQVVENINVEAGVYALSNQGSAQARIAVNGAATSGAYAAATSAAPLTSASATANQAVTVEFTTGTLDRVQLDPGTVATPFERRPYSLELSLCQRYLPAFNSTSTGTEDIGTGGAATGTTGYAWFVFPVEPRVPPTGIVNSALAGFSFNTMTLAGAVTGLSFYAASKRMCRLSITAAAATYAANSAAVLYSTVAGAQILFTGAEL